MNTDVRQLLPCPFCGGDPVEQEHPPHDHPLLKRMGIEFPDHLGSFTVECPKCGVGLIQNTAEEVRSAWNRRAALSAPEPREPLVKTIERVLDDNSAWISSPNKKVVRDIAWAAAIAAQDMAKEMVASGSDLERVEKALEALRFYAFSPDDSTPEWERRMLEDRGHIAAAAIRQLQQEG